MSGRAAASEATQHLAYGRFAAAHRALLDDPTVQFRLMRTPPPTPPPAWLRAIGEWLARVFRPIGRALARLGRLFPDWPYARILLWSVIVLFAATVLWMAVERVRYGEWRRPRLPRRRAAAPPAAQEEPAIEPGLARALLQEADALAALGRFAEAAHLLLFRSVEDLARRRPGAVRPALTSRELAAAPAFPPLVRERFAAIAALVERSVFGGRLLDAGDWQVARSSYAELALRRAWRR